MLLRLLEHLDPAYECHVISLSTAGTIGSRIEALGVPVHSVGMAPGTVTPFTLWRLLSLIRVIRPDLVQTWMYHADLLGGLAARLAGVPALIWGIHNSGRNVKMTTRLTARLCALVSKAIPNKIVLCSEMAHSAHTRLGYDRSKTLVIPNGFDLARYCADPASRGDMRRELDLEVDAPVVGMIGRWHPDKDHLGFIEAAGRLHRRMPSAMFVLAGEGVDHQNSRLVAALEEQDVIRVTRLLGLRSDIPRVMAALDVLALSSIAESFPNVIGEAMACSVPCAVTDVGDCAHLVGNTGRVVPPRDAVALAGALEDLLSLLPAERQVLGARARARVEENFEIGSIARRYQLLYDELLAVTKRLSDGRAYRRSPQARI